VAQLDIYDDLGNSLRQATAHFIKTGESHAPLGESVPRCVMPPSTGAEVPLDHAHLSRRTGSANGATPSRRRIERAVAKKVALMPIRP
jgi:hypothetical protein